MRPRSRGERGIALPTPVAALSIASVVLAGVAFVATSGGVDESAQASGRVAATPTPTPVETASQPVIEDKQQPKPKKKPKPEVRRGEVYVEVYNNTGISGLAGATAEKISGAGWKVVGSDNWYGTIPASTVYYPDRLEQAARLLARDIGIKRLKPAISPMKFDRLTVILTSDAA